MELKWCSKCKDAKPLDQFDFANREKNIRHGWCKDCYHRYNRSTRPKAKHTPGRAKGTLLADYLVKKRKQAFRKASDFAKQVDVSRQFISQIESGKAAVPEWLLKLYRNL